jgi:hypothetical protein
MSDRREWTEADLSELSWHDNHIHGLRIAAGEFGAGELVLDIDYIFECLHPSETTFAFRVAPATLTFHRVVDLRINVDYATVAAGIVPPSIDGITRESIVHPNGSVSYRWTIKLSWPEGSITFSAGGFSQRLRAEPTTLDRQCLEAHERG